MEFKVKRLGDLTEPIIRFAEDAGEAETVVDSDASQYNRRVFVRALFAMVEGTTYFLKQTALSTGVSLGKLTPYDLLLLQDAVPELRSNGQSYAKTKFIPLEDNLRFTARILKDVYDIDFGLRVGTKQWESLKSAAVVRNRITHPKRTEDFDISDDDLRIMKDVRSWFCQLIADAAASIHKFITPYQQTQRMRYSESTDSKIPSTD